MLPSHPLPVYEEKLDGLEKPLTFSPFTIADQRNLRAALTFKDPKAFVATVVSVVERQTNLRAIHPAFQLHYIEAAFLKVYVKSVGGVLDASYRCDAMVDPNPPALQELAERHDMEVEKVECGFTADIKIPIDDASIDFGQIEPGKPFVARLSTGAFVTLEVPGWDVVKKFSGEDGRTVAITEDFVLACVTSVGDADAVYTRADFSDDELRDWLDALPGEDEKAFDPFFSSLPVITKTVEVVCPKCGSKKKIELRGLDDFFV